MGTPEEDREREDEARQRRADAEAERAESERADELGDDAGEGIIPGDADAERRGVMRPPEGAGAD